MTFDPQSACQTPEPGKFLETGYSVLLRISVIFDNELWLLIINGLLIIKIPVLQYKIND